NLANIVIVSVTLASLLAFVVAGLPSAVAGAEDAFTPFFQPEPGAPLPSLLYAAALMFVAFTGYARTASLGAEVKEPRRTVPRAVIAALAVVMVLYLAVAFVGVGADDRGALSQASAGAAPLVAVAQGFESALGGPAVGTI